MKKVLYLILAICIGVSSTYATPVPTEDGDNQPYYLDEHNVLRDKAPSGNKTEQVKTNGVDSNTPSVYNENTPKFKYEPIKEEVDDESNPINYDASSDNIKDKNFTPNERSIDDELFQTEKVNNTNKRTRTPKQLKRKQEEEQLKKEMTLKEEMPENNMSSPEQKHYSQEDYEQAYRDMQVPTFSYHHGIDPDQYYDMKDATWSPYPLFRLNSPLYFKNVVIPPGYYLLTPRQYKSKWYILFKEAGTVRYIIPVFDQSYVEAGYYHTHLKELDMCKTARWQIKFLNAWGKYIKKSKRKPPIQTNLELTDLDNNFLLIEIYYGPYRYSTIFRTEKF